MKIFFRILYISVIFILVVLVQMSGGAQARMWAAYFENNVHRHPNDPIATAEILSSIFDIYIDPNYNNWQTLSVDTPNNEFSFDLTFIPYGNRRNLYFTRDYPSDQTLNLFLDGFLIWLNPDSISGSTEFQLLNLEFFALNQDLPLLSPLNFSIEIRTVTSGSQALPAFYTLLDTSALFTQDIERQFNVDPIRTPISDSRINWNTIGNYDISAILISHTFLNEHNRPEQEVIFYGWEPNFTPHVNAAVDALQLEAFDNNFFDEYLMYFSRRLFGQQAYRPTTNNLLELAENGEIVFIVANLSPYIYWHFIIWGFYIVFVLVIPFFWFLRKPLKEFFALKKEQKQRRAVVKQKNN